MLGNIEGRRRREQHRMRWLDDITNSMDMFSSVHFSCSVMSDFLRPQYAKLPCPSPFPRQCSNSCPESIQNFILSHPLLLLPSILPSIRVFSNESALRLRWQKYWTFSFDISPSSEYPGLISFRIDWLDLLAVQGTLKTFLQ